MSRIYPMALSVSGLPFKKVYILRRSIAFTRHEIAKNIFRKETKCQWFDEHPSVICGVLVDVSTFHYYSNNMRHDSFQKIRMKRSFPSLLFEEVRSNHQNRKTNVVHSSGFPPIMWFLYTIFPGEAQGHI